jgi:phosphatidylserine/phosphatidylglycerophosphate/cardiolipin synthase-like enzyme
MNCFEVSDPIIRQIWSWATSLVVTVFKFFSAITENVQQWLRRWRDQSTAAASQACNSLPWPLSALCYWATWLACTLVSVLILVIWLIIIAACTIIAEIIALAIATALTLFVWLLCIIVPCSQEMESATPPDAGWIVTLSGSTGPGLSSDNFVSVLPDGMSACQAILDAINSATIRIHLLELSFDPNFDAVFAADGSPSSLAGALLAANQGENAVTVRVLLNQNAFANKVPALVQYFADPAHAPNSVEVLGFHVSPAMMHAKALIIDDSVAFIVGLPLDQGYWDTQQHLVTDARRGTGAGGDVPGLGGVGNGVGKKPVHTVSLQLSGQAASDVDATFISLWNSVSTDQISPPQPAIDTGSGQSVQIIRSAPRLTAAGLPAGETGTLEAYLRAINNAMSFIYLEAQYFTSPVIGDALSHALRQVPSLQVILLLNENPDMPTYKWWQDRKVRQLTKLAPGRVGAFTLWRTEVIPGKPNEIMQCYVESKVGIVDDAWATVGSGNLDGASLGHIFELFPPPVSCFSSGWRNFELGAILYDGIAGQPATGEVANIRRSLWQEHLGTANLPGSPPVGGWLAVWNQIAQENIASLNSSQVLMRDSRILPYATALDPKRQLAELGVYTSMLTVAPAVPT